LLPLCHSCGSAVERLTFGDGLCSHPLCNRCAEAVPACQHRACKACVLKCASCRTTMCKDCNSECEYDGCSLRNSSLGLCDKHKRLCADCEVCVCDQHRRFCRICQRTFCALCYEDHGWKMADCGHQIACGAKPGLCRVCKHSSCSACEVACRICGRFVCDKHAGECLGCELLICERCAGPECDLCGDKSCKEHSFSCKACSRNLCCQDVDWCAVCRRALCGTHLKYCGLCRGALCPRHGLGIFPGLDGIIHCIICERNSEMLLLPCDHCQNRLPSNLLTRGRNSNQFYCISCSAKCSQCNSWSLEFRFGKCGDCGVILCYECLENHAYSCASLSKNFPTSSAKVRSLGSHNARESSI
jgi:hypothetical protein